MPAHRTVLVSGHDAPPPCHEGFHISTPNPHLPSGPGTAPTLVVFMHSAKWDYWTQHGAWVLWNGLGEVHPADWPYTQFRPYLHNWFGSPWPVREYFWCVDRGH